MADPTKIISNTTSLLVIAGLAVAYVLQPAAVAPTLAGAGPNVEITLEAMAPEPPKAEAAAAVEQPPAPETPPPPPPPPEEVPPPPVEPPQPEPAQPILDEDGAPPPPPPPLPPEISDTAAKKFKACLANKTFYPSSKEARKLKPHGVVEYVAVLTDKGITSVEIIVSSGSPILDAAAKATVTKSGCGLQGETGSVKGTIQY